MDALGSAIRVDSRGREVIRILPRINEAINEEWISDKTRHVVDGLKVQRIDRPYVRVGGKLKPATWPEAFAADRRQGEGDAAGKDRRASSAISPAVEEMFALKGLMEKLGSTNIDCRQDGSKLHPKFGRASYLFNSTIAGIDEADAIMVIGSNPRSESPVLNARIRKRWLRGDCLTGVLGPQGRSHLAVQLSRRGPGLAGALRRSSAGEQTEADVHLWAPAPSRGPTARRCWRSPPRPRPRSACSRTAGTASTCCIRRPRRVGGLDLGLVPGEGGLDALAMAKAGALDLIINLGADEIEIEPGAFVVYIGTHGDRGAHRADVILPGAAYTEKTGTYVNTEGRPQFAERAVFPPGDAREDWAILRALSERARRHAALRFPERPARGARGGASASRQIRRDHAGRPRRLRGHRGRRADRRKPSSRRSAISI